MALRVRAAESGARVLLWTGRAAPCSRWRGHAPCGMTCPKADQTQALRLQIRTSLLLCGCKRGVGARGVLPDPGWRKQNSRRAGPPPPLSVKTNGVGVVRTPGPHVSPPCLCTGGKSFPQCSPRRQNKNAGAQHGALARRRCRSAGASSQCRSCCTCWVRSTARRAGSRSRISAGRS